MRSNDAARDPRNAAHKNHSTPSLLLHRWDAQLREQVRRAAIDAPRLLEVFNGKVGNGFHAAATARRARVVDEDGGCTEQRNNGGVHSADLCGCFSADRASEGQEVVLVNGSHTSEYSPMSAFATMKFALGLLSYCERSSSCKKVAVSLSLL
jgi:hypothetical protein